MGIKRKAKRVLIGRNYYIKRDYNEYLKLNPNKMKKLVNIVNLNLYYRVFFKNKYKLPVEHSNQPGNRGRINKLDAISRRRIKAEGVAKNLLKYDVISFDIFDTLIFRPFSNPRNMASIIGQDIDTMFFNETRFNAEMRAREKATEQWGVREANIYEIYEEFCKMNGKKNSKELAEKEFEFELDFCYQNTYMKKIWDILKANNKKIVVITDMYMSEEMIKKILEKNGFGDYDNLFVSCEYRKNKYTGGLFIEANKVIGDLSKVHIGDNISADVRASRKYGFDSILYENVNKFKTVDSYIMSAPLDLQTSYIGVINAYLNNGNKNYSTLYKYGFVVGGYYILGFISWLNTMAKKDNIDKYLFLSRDGRIYHKGMKKHFPNVGSEYVLWSRFVSTKLYFEKSPELFIKRFIQNKKSVSKVGDLLKELDLEFLISDLKDYKLEEETLLVKGTKDLFIKLLMSNYDEIVNKYNEESNIAKEYYVNKIGNAKTIGVVDVGWQGSGGAILKWLIEEKWQLDCKVTCYNAAYLQNNSKINFGLLQNGILKTYLFSSNENRDNFRKMLSQDKGLLIYIFELFTQDTTPSFKGFMEDGKKCFSFSEPEVDNYDSYREIQEGILDFIDEYMRHFKGYDLYMNIPPVAAFSPFKHFVSNKREMLGILGNINYEVDSLKSDSNKNIRDMYREKGLI